MLPASYATPAALVLALGGLLACFAGYRLFRLVLGIYGFMLGAFVTTSMMGAANIWALALAAVVGGLVGAVLMIAAYFIGVGLVGAGLAALVLNLLWRVIGNEPPTWLLVVVCVLGALGALSVVRWVVVFGTAIAGSWTLIVGVVALLGNRAALTAASAGDVWVFYPLHPMPDRWWYTVIWVVIAAAGVVVQLATTGKGAGRKRFTSAKRTAA
jgi:hypothetical protein